jgi:phenylalanyl-tRNA synthetase alpha chain
MTTTGMAELEASIASLAARFRDAVASASDARALDEVRVAFLDRTGAVSELRKGIGKLPPPERSGASKIINEALQALEAELGEARARIERAALERSLDDVADVTLPGPPANIGAIHPVRRVAIDVARYFTRHGFAVVLGREIETGASDGLDAFALRSDLVLRTHVSPAHVRAMREHGPPIAIIVLGKTYRREAADARHLPVSHHAEGLMIGRGIHFGHLKGLLAGMCRELFGPSDEMRLRPSFFPFTEPSAEIDVTCGRGWITLGRSGMIHPSLLRAAGCDSDAVTGWTFGCGLERIAMKRYGVDDIRAFIENAPGFAEALA